MAFLICSLIFLEIVVEPIFFLIVMCYDKFLVVVYDNFLLTSLAGALDEEIDSHVWKRHLAK